MGIFIVVKVDGRSVNLNIDHIEFYAPSPRNMPSIEQLRHLPPGKTMPEHTTEVQLTSGKVLIVEHSLDEFEALLASKR